MKITRYLMTRDFTAHRVQWLHYLLFGGSMLSMVFSSLARRILKKKKKDKRQKENRLHRITSTPIHEYSWHCLIMQSTLALQTLCNCASTVTCSCSFKNLHKLLRSWYEGKHWTVFFTSQALYETCKFFLQILVLKPAKIWSAQLDSETLA